VNRKVHTKEERKASLTEMNRSAITDHVARNNYVIKWTGAEIIEGRVLQYKTSERIHLNQEPKNCMNRDAGAYDLSSVYDSLLVMRVSSYDHLPDEVCRW